ncbi:MORN repeat-containing protein 4-like [Watersipora subatra]|uniref:MORN repeat-containing protein 4-like n=1 Tax=Watersipora subatra TaxID=2589382 RepID=UPI00355BD9AF
MAALSTKVFKYSDGTEYEGQWNADGEKHGVGSLTLPDGSHYRGQFASGLSSGLGVMIFSDGSSYAGDFTRGKFNGYGVYVRQDKMMYQGQFLDGRPEGYGLTTFPDGSHGIPRNEGYFENFKLKRADKSHTHVQKANLAAEKAKQHSN